MKRFLSGLFLLLLLVLAGCQSKQPEELTTTVMVYMVGSDLEAKSAAGTRDLEEMLASSVDLSKTNVLVYAGGSAKWHNDSADPEKHTLLLLTEQGFEEITSTQTYSMGESQCLSTFLRYGYHNLPAQQYALILWDHGNGPVIGYGKDMLFGNDCLTLKEMQQALQDSPFGGDVKLRWVGFDACLMASAELACIWAPYADYLVASQEIEPAFGWNYSFLSQVSSSDTEGLLTGLAQEYLSTCLAYYEKQGYEDRDTTLSCIDLRFVPELETALNDLFARANGDIQTEYNQLAARRVQTRALGRASTGSEYDLIDLNDMGMWLGEMYPDEVIALQKVLSQMTVVNANNSQNLCGMSLYYPFYNKGHYEGSWSAAYKELGVFSAYQTYLASYEDIWLSADKLALASSTMPSIAGENTYTLQLTGEQNENLASVKYHILTRDGEEYFTKIFSSSQVENRNGLLTAGFDGRVLYVTNDFADHFIPVSTENDRLGDMGRYSVRFALTNYEVGALYLPEGYETQMQAHRYTLNVDSSTGQVTISSLQPFQVVDGEDALIGGKVEDASLAGWTNAFFLHDSHRYLSRYENGTIMPVDQWPADTMLSGVSYALENGLEFVYAPLAAGEYYLLFEMEDTQGNRYCSELLPIQTDYTLPLPSKETKPTQLRWTSGDKILLTEQNGVSVWLKTIESFSSLGYALEVCNNSDTTVEVNARNLYLGQDLYCNDFFASVRAEPGQTATSDYGSDLGPVSDLDLATAIAPIRFELTICNGITLGITHHEAFQIELSDSTWLPADEIAIRYNGFSQPVCAALAENQLLLETDRLRVTLLGFGSNGQDGSVRLALCLENRTDQPLPLELQGIRLNDLYLDPLTYGTETVPPQSRTYIKAEVPFSELKKMEITSLEQVSLLLRQSLYNPLFSGNALSELHWCDVTLSQKGSASPLPEGTVLYEEKGIRVSLLPRNTVNTSSCKWEAIVTNTSGQDISLDVVDILADGEPLSGQDYFSVGFANSVPEGMSTPLTLSYSDYTNSILPESVTFQFRIMDFKGEAILYTSDQILTLTVPETPDA